MKEAYIDKDLNVEIRDVPVPTAGPGELLIRTVVSGTNPKDCKLPKLMGGDPANQGDDIAGYVEAVGEAVTGFRPGDRVAAFHQMFTPHGSYAEYSVAAAKSVFHLPNATTFEEGATIPLAGMTAALGVYQRLQLPLPWNPVTVPTPLVVNGAATAVGAFAIKFASLSNVHPIIAIAGNGIPFVDTLLDKSKGDIIIDYRQGAEYVNEELRKVAEKHVISYAYDTVSDKASLEMLSKVVSAENGKIMSVVPKEDEVTRGITVLGSNVGHIHESAKEGFKVGNAEFGATIYNLVSLGLADGWFSGHPYEVAKGGLAGLEGALKDLYAGKVSAKKYVLRLAETPLVLKEVKSTLPYLLASPAKNRNPGSTPGGHIIFVSATFYYTEVPYRRHVAAAKTGVDALSASATLNNGPRRLKSNVISSGGIAEIEVIQRLPSKASRESGQAARNITVR
ncbi:Polyketide synthase enoylreductase [Fusarium acutatum]|uniref:Polyketide synthase enoylreductase n=1 Tax=Fusarium acutatum TaxID=78861 RepID=A0A8H4JAQ9_9HYPO|nr:Polyketide synthase enoylreductase [Fusarium acutatum]